MSGPARRPFFRRKKTCPFTGDGAPKIDYKDVRLLHFRAWQDCAKPYHCCFGQAPA